MSLTSIPFHAVSLLKRAPCVCKLANVDLSRSDKDILGRSALKWNLSPALVEEAERRTA